MAKGFQVIAGLGFVLAGAGLVHSWQTAQELDTARRVLARQETDLAEAQRSLRDLLESRSRPSSRTDDGLDVPSRTSLADRAERTAAQEREPTEVEQLPEDPNDPSILVRFADLEPRDKERALNRLGEMAREGDPAAFERILASLLDENDRVREEAVETLGELSNPAAFAGLAALQADPSNDVREEVAESMASMPAGQAGPILAAMLVDRTQDVVEQALESLERLQYRGALPQIIELARGDQLDLVARSARVLRALGEPLAAQEAMDRVALGLQSKDAIDRVQTVRYLRRAGGLEAISYLEQVARNDASLSVREEARDALDRLRD